MDPVTGSAVDLVVSDNGRGFDDSSVTGNGLANLRKRAEHLAGTFMLESPPGGGTRLVWCVPPGADTS